MGVEDWDSASPDESNLDTDVQPETAAEEGSESSAEADEGAPESILDVVRNATDIPDDTPDSPAGEESSDTSEEGGEAASEDPDGREEAAEPDDENFTDVPFHKHPRFQRLVQERNKYREGAQQFDNVQNYLRENGMTGEDAAEALDMFAQAKRDPAAAWAKFKPFVQDLLVRSGELLPQDLQQQVRQGQMSKQAALEVSRARAMQSGVTQRQEHDARVQQEQAQHQRATSMQNAAAEWEQAMRGKDREFDAKAEALQKEVLWLQRRDGMPQDAAGVRKVLDEAWRNVRASAPKAERKPAVTPVTGGRGAGGNQQPAPKSVLEIVQRGG